MFVVTVEAYTQAVEFSGQSKVNHGARKWAAGRRASSNRAADKVYNQLTEAIMEAVRVQLDQDLVELLEELERPAKQAARELIVLELYRQGEVSSGRAAQLLSMEREEFIRYASKQGIPYFQLEGEELQRELDAIKKL